MNKIIEVKLLPRNKLFVKYSDNVKGEIDLTKISFNNVQKEIANSEQLESVRIEDKSGDIVINNGEIELCKNATYEILKLRAQMRSFGIDLDES